MEETVTTIIGHMAASQDEMTILLENKRCLIQHMSRMIAEVPDHDPDFGGMEHLLGHTVAITKGVGAYLHGLSDLEEALAAHLELVMKQLNGAGGDE